MKDNIKNIFGEHDQELLFRAFAHFAANTTSKSINVIIGMIRLSILHAVESLNISIDETNKLNEGAKRQLIENGIDEFLKRVKVGSVHQREIRKGCMTIYHKWREIRAALKEERDIHLEELLEDKSSSLIGYEDQEVLLAAFAHYISIATNKERNIVIKLIRVCMLEVTIPRRINFKEARYLDETTRKDMIIEGIGEYFKRAHISGLQADTIKSDCLRVYERWKEIRRVEPSKEYIELLELIS